MTQDISELIPPGRLIIQIADYDSGHLLVQQESHIRISQILKCDLAISDNCCKDLLVGKPFIFLSSYEVEADVVRGRFGGGIDFEAIMFGWFKRILLSGERARFVVRSLNAQEKLLFEPILRMERIERNECPYLHVEVELSRFGSFELSGKAVSLLI